MKTTILSLSIFFACFFPMQLKATPVSLEPFSKEQSMSNFDTKEFVEYDPEEVSFLERPNSLPLFSSEEKAKEVASVLKKKAKNEIKIISLKEYLSSSLEKSSLKNTFLSFAYENAKDEDLEESLFRYISLGGVVHISKALSHPEGVQYIKSLSQKSFIKNASIHCILSGDGVIFYSTTYHPVEVSPILEACTESFLETIESENLLKMEKTILSSISSKELHIFDWMEKPTMASAESAPLYPLLWKGLFFLEQKDYLEASRCFHKALASGVDHWRVYWYISLAETERRNYPEAKRALQHVLSEVPDFKDAQDLLERIEEV